VAAVTTKNNRRRLWIPTTALASGCFLLSPSSSVAVAFQQEGISVCRSPYTTVPASSALDSTKNNMADNTEEKNEKLQFVDIGANLLDDRFTKGIYHDKFRHEPDLDDVLARAAAGGVRHIVLTAGTLEESARAVQYVRQLRQQPQQQDASNGVGIHFSCTVGVHPTRCQQEFVDHADGKSDDEILHRLLEIAQDGMTDGCVAAIGEIGLDYDRLQFAPKDTQVKYFQRQLEVLVKTTKLPMFLHNRNVGTDLYDILKDHSDCWQGQGGVVHSFDDSLELAHKFMDELGLYIGLNGCSLKTQDNLQVVQALPLDKLLLETDCPYCEIKRTHAGFSHITTTFESKAEKKFVSGVMVKGRCEPCQIVQVAQVIAGVKGISVRQVADQCYQTSLALYGWKE